MDDHLLFFLVLFLLLSAGGVALLWIGLSGIRKARGQAERERARVSGTVVDLAKHWSLGRGKPLTACYPVVEFRVDGKTHRHESRAGYWPDQLKIGERVDILYDADDPGHFHLEKPFERQVTVDKVTAIFGVLWLIVAGIVAYLVSR